MTTSTTTPTPDPVAGANEIAAYLAKSTQASGIITVASKQNADATTGHKVIMDTAASMKQSIRTA